MDAFASQSSGPDLSSIKRYDRSFFGHPMGLFILSMNEVWERFSFYGMKAILVLFMITDIDKGGMGISIMEAGAIYGLYTCLAATTILPGAWIADTILGQRKTLLWGGIIIAAGHLAMAFQGTSYFFIGLLLITIGTGFLKPASTIMVSGLYAPNDPRQEAGYTIYYMCINVGAMLGPIACGYVAQQISWHMGFGLAAAGMMLGLIVYVLGYPLLGEVGKPTGGASNPVVVKKNTRVLISGTGILGVVIALLALGNFSGFFSVTFAQISAWMGVLLVALPIVYFAGLFIKGNWTRTERNHLIVIMTLFFFSIFFWAASDQRGSLMMLFAEKMTHCSIGSWAFPSSWFASVNPALVILMTPFFAWLWPRLGKRDPSTPAKFIWALMLTTLSFVVMVIAAQIAGAEKNRVGPEWLLIHLFIITVAEMCLSPVGMSAFARLAPRAIASQVMGIWFLRGSLAGLLAGAAGSAYDTVPLPLNFGTTAVVVAAMGVLLLFLTPIIRQLMKPSSSNEDETLQPSPSKGTIPAHANESHA